jgi:hypothetical protein
MTNYRLILVRCNRTVVMFLILLWLISLVAIAVYIVAWPTTKPWSTRIAFEAPVLVLLVLIYAYVVSPRPPASGHPSAVAEAAQWLPYCAAVYFARLSIIDPLPGALGGADPSCSDYIM